MWSKRENFTGSNTQEATKFWNDQRRRSSTQLKRRREAILYPSILWDIKNWSENRSLCLLNSFDKAHVPTLLLALLILTTPPTHSRSVEWAAICYIFFFLNIPHWPFFPLFFLIFFPSSVIAPALPFFCWIPPFQCFMQPSKTCARNV